MPCCPLIDITTLHYIIGCPPCDLYILSIHYCKCVLNIQIYWLKNLLLRWYKSVSDIIRCITGQDKKIEIYLPSGQVNFSFHLPPLAPREHSAWWCIVQINCLTYLAVFSSESVSFWKLSFTKLILSAGPLNFYFYLLWAIGPGFFPALYHTYMKIREVL